ncbi:hypothetical protein ATZ33_07440 [Enterococcus silesiacus]|nr:hypothetical protein [Enterococcus silesiacus]ALS01206.1 hypothetical protein ATZ33_07440 [Enterococcus silesiacus]
MNRKWKVIISLLILSIIFPLGVSGASRYFTFYLPIDYGTTKNISKATTDSLDSENTSTNEHSIFSESIEVEAITNSLVEGTSSSLEWTITSEKGLEEQPTQDSEIESRGQADAELQQEGEQ